VRQTTDCVLGAEAVKFFSSARPVDDLRVHSPDEDGRMGDVFGQCALQGNLVFAAMTVPESTRPHSHGFRPGERVSQAVPGSYLT
jgi:hypothetical protein